MSNFQVINTVEGGNSKEVTDVLERKNTFDTGINGRLYSKNGAFSFNALDGTKLVYENSSIVKWLGSYSFRDEMIVFAKCLKPTDSGEGQESEVCEQKIFSESFSKTVGVLPGTSLYITNLISDNSQQIESCYTVIVPKADPTDFRVPYSSIQTEAETINFGEYYNERVNVADFSLCSINLNEIPRNNLDYYDTIVSFTLDDEGVLSGERIWTGAQNWPIDGKITCEGVEENEFYKRVYYTDAVNFRRVVNRKDASLSVRKASEFNQILDNVLLQPEVVTVKDGGQLPAMKSLYLYRIISENGQVSEFSPFSSFVAILPENTAITYKGGDISENTGKMVEVKCNILNPEASSEIECIALEFEALGSPTSIRNLGIKPAAATVFFNHFGNEPELADDITINDVLEFKNTWKYCNDFSSKKNKLIAAGLRNEPVPTAIQNLEYLFALHSWDAAGNTFETLMNPEPWNYKYIDPTNTSPLIYVKQKKYEDLSSYGPLILSFTNRLIGVSLNVSMPFLSLEKYTDILPETIAWLVNHYNNNADFNNLFPNLKVSNNAGQLLLSPVDENLQYDFSDYVFESNNNQFIQNFKNDIIFFSPAINTSKLVRGAESIGFNQGNGVRVSYREFKEPLLNEAKKIYDGTGKILDYETPSGETYCMKGEIHRLALQTYDKASSRYFAIPMGDVMVPELGEYVTEIDDQGNPNITIKTYVNQSVKDGILYGHGIKMHIEVRLDCEMQKLISMYQILYVERTEENRTILCQGIAAPLSRIQNNGEYWYEMPEPVQNKWNLPYYGGPTYERSGLDQYDLEGENFNYLGDGSAERIIVNRSLMTFDSPDLYFEKISSQYLKTSKAHVIARLNTDHTKNVIMQGGDSWGRDEIYPKFSRKIREDYLDGELNLEGLPRHARQDRGSGHSLESYFINVSVFSKFTSMSTLLNIDAAEDMNRGEIISGQAFELDHDVSNNAVAMPCPPWYYSLYQKRGDDQKGKVRANLYHKGSMVSPGYGTTIIKTSADLFTDAFIGPDIHIADPEMRLGGGPHNIVYDSYALINIFRNNREAVYGGRSEQAYSRNTYIPLSKTIPVLKSTGVQSFDVGADTYLTLNIRTKNDAGDGTVEEIEINNGGGGRAKGEILTFTRNGAWNYVTVLETQVEPKQTYDYEFYRQTGTFKFNIIRSGIINEAYFNTVNLKQYIPKPFKFKDDPNMGNVIAVSNVKLSGEEYDSWTKFLPNNFYAELEKNKGDVSNLFRFKEQLFAIQEDQTSLIYIGTDRIVNDNNGTPINIKQGTGMGIDGHKVLSGYGTSIRRAVSVSDFGFSFFDEKKIEFVKMDQALFHQNMLHLEHWDRFKNDRIVDTEAFFDHEHKETNIRIRTASGKSTTFSYNESFKIFNGEYDHFDNDIFMSFDNKMYAPKRGVNNQLHQLNEGDPLDFFGSQRLLKLKVIVHTELDKVFQYKRTGVVSSIDYPVAYVIYETSLGQRRVVFGTHPYYKMREGNHSIPAKNEIYTSSELADLRGNWVSIEITAESINKNKVDILAIVNYLRLSHQ